MTGEQLLSDVALSVGEMYSDYRAKKFFDQALGESINELLGEGLWPFARKTETVNVVASTQEYTVPAAVGELLELAEIREARLSGDNISLRLLESPDVLHEHQYDDDLEGVPRYLYVAEDTGLLTVGLYPIPSTAYTLKLHGVGRLHDNWSVSLSLPFPTDVTDVLRVWVRYKYGVAAEGVGEEQFQRVNSERLQGLNRLKSRYLGPRQRRYKKSWSDVPRGEGFGQPEFPDSVTYTGGYI